MKKIIAVFLCPVFIILSVFPVFAAGMQKEEREYLEDGSYFIEVVSDSIKKENEQGIFAKLFDFLKRLIEFFKGQKTVTKTKHLNYYSSDNELLWTAKLTGEFIYSKSTAVCSSAEFSMEIYDSDWLLQSSECEEAGDTAAAEFTVKQYKLLVPLKTIEKRMTLTCDTKGNVR